MKIARLLAIHAVLALSGCHSDEAAGTAPGTIVDQHYGPELSGSHATLGEPAGPAETTRRTFDVDVGEGGFLDPEWLPIRLRFEIEHGPVTVQGASAGQPHTLEIPRVMRVVVVDSAHFEVVPTCDESLTRGVFLPGTFNEREGIYRSCSFDLRRGESNVIINAAIFGDGEVRLDVPRNGLVTPVS